MKYKGRILKMWKQEGENLVRCRFALQFAEVANEWRRLVNPTARRENQKLSILFEETFFSDYTKSDEKGVAYSVIKSNGVEWDISTFPLPSQIILEADILPFYPERDWIWKAKQGTSIVDSWVEEEENEIKTSSISDTAESNNRRVSSELVETN